MAGRYYTTESVARKMVELAAEVRLNTPSLAMVGPRGITIEKAYEGVRVCEPSAGEGGIARHVPSTVENLTMIEKSKSAFERLVANVGKAPNRTFLGGDFLLLPKPGIKGNLTFDIGLMNPPYEDGNDVIHTGQMLDFAPFVVGLYRTNVSSLVTFHKMLEEKKANLVGKVELGRPKFTGPDDQGDGARHDYAILVISSLAQFDPPYVPWLKFFELSKRKARAAASR